MAGCDLFMNRVVELTPDQLSWPFDGQPGYWYGKSHVRIDPFPAYAHDVKLVKDTLRKVEKAVKIKHKPTIYILHHEYLSRTNGFASQGYNGYNNERQQYNLAPGQIVLCAKRIPIHPGMTRYLVSHEYGHHVDWSLCEKRGVKLDGGLDKEYAALRKLPQGWERYGGGQWHNNVGEFIANDFRILITETEVEFWPHPGYARPEKVKGLQQWWEEALA